MTIRITTTRAAVALVLALAYVGLVTRDARRRRSRASADHGGPAHAAGADAAAAGADERSRRGAEGRQLAHRRSDVARAKGVCRRQGADGHHLRRHPRRPREGRRDERAARHDHAGARIDPPGDSRARSGAASARHRPMPLRLRRNPRRLRRPRRRRRLPPPQIRAFSLSGCSTAPGATTRPATTRSPSRDSRATCAHSRRAPRAHEAQLYIARVARVGKEGHGGRRRPTIASSPITRDRHRCRRRTTSAGWRSSASGEPRARRESYETVIKQFPDTQQATPGQAAARAGEPAEP